MPKSKEPEKKESSERKKFSRRDFLTISGAAVAAQALVYNPLRWPKPHMTVGARIDHLA